MMTPAYRSLVDVLLHRAAMQPGARAYVALSDRGESSGALVDVLRRMADHFEKFAQVQAKFTSALIYPALVCCVGLGLIIFFLTLLAVYRIENFGLH